MAPKPPETGQIVSKMASYAPQMREVIPEMAHDSMRMRQLP